jgi:hypothetical protein
MSNEPTRIYDIAVQLGADEQRVLLRVAERLLVGRKQYGELRLGADQRDWRRECMDECADGLVYAACAMMSALTMWDET